MFHVLRQHRRLIGLAVLATLTVWLSAMLASCLTAPMQRAPAAVATAMAGMEPAAMIGSEMDECPGGLCATMQSDRELSAEHDIVPAAPKLILLALFFAATLFALARPQRVDPSPPDPHLPSRSPLLRFYALRI